jgi:hypothetical protein
MKRRSSRPALLELLQSPEEADAVEQQAGPPSSWPSPGRSMRVTLGHLLMVSAIVLGLLVATWMLAYRQGELRARADLESAIFQPVEQDPLAASPPPATRSEALPSPSPSISADQMTSDPRQEGLYYFVLAETRPEGAERLARFCRERGLETWLIPRDTVGLVQVLVTPGLTSATRSDPDVRELDERISSIGRAWKRAGGHSSLEDRYLVRGN